MNTKSALGLVFMLCGLGLVGWGGWHGWTQPRAGLSPLTGPASAGAPVTLRPSPTASPTPPPPPPTATATPTATQSPTRSPSRTPTATPAWRGEPIVPVVQPTSRPATAKPVSPVALGPTSTASGPAPTLAPPKALLAPGQRFGIGVPQPPLTAQTVQALGVGWYLTWQVNETPPPLPGVEFWQMIRVQESGFRPEAATIQRAAQANPGSTWLIGNEPDVRWQDNVTPEQYARWYQQLYHLIKASDPTAQVGIGGVTQPTPLRLAYLERVLAAYQAEFGQTLPVEVWNIHNFILPEQRSDWGVDIPPGFEGESGARYEMAQHDDLAIFQAQIIAFRRWLAERGWQNKPVVVSEYGLLMPADYGFPPERVARFMQGSYDFMLTATDPQLGYPADGYRLVQRWCWFSLADHVYPTGNLILPDGSLTPVGLAHRDYVTSISPSN